jgi:hypothetical protein
MNISEINDVVFEYLTKMINDDEDIDIYNITEEQYEENIIQNMLNMWDCSGYSDIITEYFGNQSTFIPSLVAFIEMLRLITEKRNDCGMETPITLFGNNDNPYHTYSNVLRHYAYWYIDDMGYEKFLLKLKDYIDEDE